MYRPKRFLFKTLLFFVELHAAGFLRIALHASARFKSFFFSRYAFFRAFLSVSNRSASQISLFLKWCASSSSLCPAHASSAVIPAGMVSFRIHCLGHTWHSAYLRSAADMPSQPHATANTSPNLPLATAAGDGRKAHCQCMLIAACTTHAGDLATGSPPTARCGRNQLGVW